MPISSLPSPYGIGTLGREAYEFVDFVKKCKHSYWQVLPLGPTSFGDSPYQGFSAFAGNPYFIDLDMLIEEGLLKREFVNSFDWGNDPSNVAYDKIYNSRFKVLRKAFEQSRHQQTEEFIKFQKKHEFWLADYALFMACKDYFKGCDWGNWEEDIRFRKPSALEKYRILLKDDIAFYEFIQFKFFEQWEKLKKYAKKNGVGIIGDIPIYVAYDSADVWSDADEFLLDEKLAPKSVAGVPPDAFTELGQKWGNPIYDWDKMKKSGFCWWSKRMEAMADMYDVIRIDHFLGVVKYYTIPAQDPDARNGEYHIGPGKALTDVMNAAIGDKKIIAEDLGVSIPEATKLLEENGYPGMKVLEFAFGGDRENTHLPFNYTTTNCVVYGGTHDNETLMGYFCNHGDWELGYAYDFLDTRDKRKMVDQVFRIAYGSIADLVIFQTQDILKLGNEARMNFPSTQGCNWKWRMRKGQLTEKELNDLRYLASVFGREARETLVKENV
jgi:4-alpha-glucanotransferase